MRQAAKVAKYLAKKATIRFAAAVNRRSFLRVSAGSGTLLWVNPLISLGAGPGEDPSQSGSEFDRRIEQHRKTDVVIRVQDDQRKPISNAKVTVQQTAHAFLFGCNFFMFGRLRDEVLEEQYRSKFADVFNYATLGFYWAGYEAERGRPNYAYTDRVLDWTSKHGIICKGHPLVWDHPAGSPGWLPQDDSELQKLSVGRVHDLISRFKGRLEIWDVVNEPTHLPDKVNRTRMAEWAEGLGPVGYTKMHLEAARAANPQATLLVNDYRTDPPYLRILEQIRTERSRLFDVIGIQSHMHDGSWSLKRVLETCDRYAKAGLPLHFTETTLLSGPRTGPGENWGGTAPALEEKQAVATEAFYRTLFSHPAVQAITWWDFSDRGAWQRAAAGWLRGDMSKKPVYERMHHLIKRMWWTNIDGLTDAQGVWAGRAFFGTYKVSVGLPNGTKREQEVRLDPARPGPVEVTILTT